MSNAKSLYKSMGEFKVVGVEGGVSMEKEDGGTQHLLPPTWEQPAV